MDTQLLAELVSHTPASGPSGVAERSSRFSWLPRQKRVIYFRVANRLVHHAAAGVSRFLQSSRASTAANIVEVLRRENAHALARNVKCIEWAPQLSILCVRVRSFLPAPASLSIERILSYGDHEKTCECFYARFFASSPPLAVECFATLSRALGSIFRHPSERLRAKCWWMDWREIVQFNMTMRLIEKFFCKH